MANVTVSTNMNLPIPTVGVDPGPDWAQNINNSLTLVDQHDHSSGSGVPVTPAGLNISSDLPFLGNNATALRSARFQPQSATIGNPADIGCLYEAGVDLYYNDGAGNQIRITASGGIAASQGNIGGLTSPATATFDSGTGTFFWQSDVNTAANMDAASYTFRNSTALSHGLTLEPPNAMGVDFTLTLPSLPVATSFVTLDTSGNIAGSVPTSGGIVGANIASATITGANVAAGTIAGSNIASNTVAASNIVPGDLTTTQLSASADILGSQLASDPAFNGKRVTASGLIPLVSAFLPSVNGYQVSSAIIRGSDGVVIEGGGMTCTRVSAGVYSMTWNFLSGSDPIILATPNLSSSSANPLLPQVIGTSSSTGADVRFYDIVANTFADPLSFNIIALGQRP